MFKACDVVALLASFTLYWKCIREAVRPSTGAPPIGNGLIFYHYSCTPATKHSNRDGAPSISRTDVSGASRSPKIQQLCSND